MSEYKISIPRELIEELEALPSKIGTWISPTIDEIILMYAPKKSIADLTKIINKHFGLSLSPRQIQNRYTALRMREKEK